MSQHLALDVDVVESVAHSAPDVDIAASMLRAHDGDALATIRELLADADFLRDQLWIASSLMSRGIGRGWRPQYERV